MRRRDFIAFFGITPSVWPLITLAQQAGTLPRIGVTLAGSAPNAFAEALRRGLAELGWVEGQTILIEERYAEGDPERYPAFIAEFIGLGMDVIVSGGGTVPARVAKQATSTIPIVIPVAGDPVASGLVASLARPGGNVTGQSMQDTEISAKRTQLLRQMLPKLARVAILNDPRSAPSVYARTAEAAVRASGLQSHIFNAGRLEELGDTLDAIRQARAEALMVLPSSIFNTHRRQLVDLIARHRLATIYEHRRFADVGGLISYGPDILEMYRSAARYVDRILKGARPADLPIEQPTKFDLVINLKTAAALGLTLPPSILLQASEAIE